jgi:hypothetical protein
VRSDRRCGVLGVLGVLGVGVSVAASYSRTKSAVLELCTLSTVTGASAHGQSYHQWLLDMLQHFATAVEGASSNVPQPSPSPPLPSPPPCHLPPAFATPLMSWLCCFD